MSYIWRYLTIIPTGPFTYITTSSAIPSGDVGNGIIDINTLSLESAPEVQTDTVIFATAPTMNSITNSGSTVTFPSVTTTLIGQNTIDTLTNKSLIDNSTYIVNNLDATKKLIFSISGVTNSSTILITSQTSNIQLSLPNITCTLVCRGSTDILTNKELTSVTNTVRAIILGTLSSDVRINVSSPPNIGQALIALSSTTAGWQNIITGTSGDVLFNNNNIITGSSQLCIDITDMYAIVGDNVGSIRPSAPTSGVKIFSRFQSGRRILSQVGPSGRDVEFQALLASNRIGYWAPVGNSTTVVVFGMNSTVVGATTRNVATTNALTSMRRIGFATTAVAGNSSGVRNGFTQFWSGNTQGLGGFHYIARFGIAVTTATACRAFVGLWGTATAITNVNPSTLTNVIGFGFDTGDTSWTFMYNDASGLATKASLTGTYPTNTTSIAMESRIYVQSNTTTVYYSLEVLNGGSYFEGSTNTNIPTNTTLLSPQIWINNGVSTAVAAIDVISQYIETEY